jgi:uncharacterized protein YgbK (DUF1537 family)
MRFGLIADDLTGACDSSVPFLAAGPVTVWIWLVLPDAAIGSLAVSTESRAESPDVGFERSRACARRLKDLGVDGLYRKVDSQMRGNVAADIAGALAGWGGRCVFAPALPEEGRRTVGGHQRWDHGDVDLHELLRAGGVDREPVVVCDAADGTDLDRIASEIAGARQPVLPAGTAGLASRLPAAFGIPPAPTGSWPACERVLAIVGTPAAALQASVATDHGKEVVVLGPGEPPPRLDGYDGVLVTGGETAARVLKALSVESLELRGEAQPRVPVAICRGGRFAGLRVALKAGAFGSAEVIDLALEALARGG